jgi:hypothetical protein
MNRAHNPNTPRDARADAPVVCMDLSRATKVIDQDLASRYPQVRGLWWELEEDEKTGWVYDSRSYIVAKLVHVTNTEVF